MAGFNFERDLPHQTDAVNSVLAMFDNVGATRLSDKTIANISNPIVKLGGNLRFTNLDNLQEKNNIDKKYKNKNSNVFDISMETGTGKTYTYTKMMFELHKNLNLSKFIVIVPTLSIKAGTLNFLKAKATKEHFRQEYNCDIKTYVVESKKNRKSKKSYMPQAVRDFVEANTSVGKKLHIMVINAGMINSDTMAKTFDVNLFDKFSTPFDAVSSVNPITIVDEPHKFATENKTWKNIEKFSSQYIFRYGATFNEKYENFIYELSAVDAFNNDLVKGVVTYVEEFTDGQNSFVTLLDTDGKKAKFELNINGIKSTYELIKKDSMSKVHEDMHDLRVENLNKSIVVLSNGLEMKKKDKINPYSYSQSIQDKMMENTIKKHFELEKELLTREVKIKPLTLFFIDDIAGYRDGHNIAGTLKTKFEALAKSYIEKALKTETHSFYRDYLQKSLDDLSLIHGGYFSKDNSESDEKIEKEINEILHDKEALLDLKNIRRFIFSKWTLREGWDNPNVFQICKLRSSGSTTSKLQEVGRGLRLPVNEYMARVKEEKFDLHYYVDFTEKDFVQTLSNEINEKSNTVWVDNPVKLTEEMISSIVNKYAIDEEKILEKLDDIGAIKRNNDFKDGGYDKLKELYPKILDDGLKKGKVKSGNKPKHKATIRTGKYQELKELWEAINQKVILEYKIDSEEQFYNLVVEYFKNNLDKFKPQGVLTHTKRLEIENNVAFYKELESLEDELLPIVTMTYKSFLVELATQTKININTLNSAFIEIKNELDINQYRNIQTIRTIKSGFNKFLLDNAIDKFSISYDRISNEIHPTKFTDAKGTVLKTINASDLGIFDGTQRVSDNYMFDELFYDSGLEKENILKNIDEVIVFTKIPKNSIRIPVAGGGTYSPDFAYIIKKKDGKKSLNLIVETKDKEKRSLYRDEEQKIKHAEELFNNTQSTIKVKFESQFQTDVITEIIKEALK